MIIGIISINSKIDNIEYDIIDSGSKKGVQCIDTANLYLVFNIRNLI
jgi:hypothetical protein